MIIENDGYFSSFCWVYTITFKWSFKNDHFKMIVYFTLKKENTLEENLYQIIKSRAWRRLFVRS